MTKKQKDFIELVAKITMKYHDEYNILNSLTIAQAILESSWGTSPLAVNGKALFGIKASDWKGKVFNVKTNECYDGKNMVQVNANFRAYDSWEESIIDHFKFLSKSRYKSLIGDNDYKSVANKIYKCGYATDPKYPQKLIRIIEQYELYKYDKKEVSEPMGIKVNKSFPCNPKNYGGKREKIEYLVIHYTANKKDKAINNCKYFQSPNRGASAHYFIGEDGIYQSVEDNQVAWSVGGKLYSDYKKTGGASYYKKCTNDNSISIELCDSVNVVPQKIKEQCKDLVLELMKKYGIKEENVIKHHDVTGKHCPASLMKSDKWNEFKSYITNSEKKVSVQEKDEDLFNAVSSLIKKGVNIEFNQWKRKDLFNLKYAEALFTKCFNVLFKTKTYDEGVKVCVDKKIITQAEIWKNKTALKKEDNVRALLIKLANLK